METNKVDAIIIINFDDVVRTSSVSFVALPAIVTTAGGIVAIFF